MELFLLQKRGRKSAIVILGGSKSKLPFLKRCKKTGYCVILFDRDENCYCKRYSDYYFRIATNQSSKIVDALERLKNLRIKGVLCYSSQKDALITTSIVANRYSLPSFTKKAVTNTYDKTKLKAILIQAGITTPPYSEATSLSSKKLSLKLPVIIKPTEGIGSYGTVIIRSKKDLEQYAHIMHGDSLKQKFIVEKYVSGKLLHIDGFVQNGRIGIFSICDKKVIEINNTPFTEGYVLLNNSAERFIKSEVIKILQKGVNSIGIDNHLFGADVIMTDDRKVYVIEIGFLMDSKMDELLSFAGIDPYKVLLNIITGQEQIRAKKLNNNYVYALKFLYANSLGRFIIKRKFEVPKGLTLKVSWEKQNNSIVDQPRSIADMLGKLIVRSKYKCPWSKIEKLGVQSFFVKSTGGVL